MVIIDGKKTANKLLDDLKQKIDKLDIKPGLAVILANDDPASRVYVASKKRKADELGIESYSYKFDSSVTQNQLIQLIKELNRNKDVNGILVQLPLYEHLNEEEVIKAIDPVKDVDGFHPENVGLLNCNLRANAVPCTPKGIIKLLKAYDITVEGKNAVVIGRSNIVGKPTATLLTNENATVTIAHTKTKDLKAIVKNADIIVSATGQPKLIKEDMVKKGAVVIDVGIVKNHLGLLEGDVDFEKVKNKAGFITPVPGGVGPMTIACLMENTYELYMLQN